MEILEDLLAPGKEAFDIEMAQMLLRAVIVYLAAIVMVRLGNKRFMGRNTAFDLLLGIMLGSVLSRGITGQAPLWHSIASGAGLVGAHLLISGLSFRFHALGSLVKGRPRILVKDGEVIQKNMRRSMIGQHDLTEAIRLCGHPAELERVKLAHLERNGDVSVILEAREPRILEVKVEKGVQTVRIELS